MPSAFVEINMDAILGLGAVAIAGLVGLVVMVWVVPLLIAALIADALTPHS